MDGFSLSGSPNSPNFLPAALGPPKYLCEEELVKWIAGCAEVGYAKSVCEIRAVVGAIVSNKLGLDTPIVVSHGWWDHFCQHHPHLVLCASEGTIGINE